MRWAAGSEKARRRVLREAPIKSFMTEASAPSGAKAPMFTGYSMAGLKPRPFKTGLKLKPRPFKTGLKLKPRLSKRDFS